MPDIISKELQKYIQKHKPEVMPGRRMVYKENDYWFMDGKNLERLSCCDAVVYLIGWLIRELTPYGLTIFGPAKNSPDWLVRVRGALFDSHSENLKDALFDTFKKLRSKK